jgi:hypothetical protein
VKGAILLVAWAARLDDAIAALGRVCWRAVIDGFASYGETLCGPVTDSYSRADNDGYEYHEKPTMPSLLFLENDRRTWQEYEHIEDLLELLRHRQV